MAEDIKEPIKEPDVLEDISELRDILGIEPDPEIVSLKQELHDYEIYLDELIKKGRAFQNSVLAFCAGLAFAAVCYFGIYLPAENVAKQVKNPGIATIVQRDSKEMHIKYGSEDIVFYAPRPYNVANEPAYLTNNRVKSLEPVDSKSHTKPGQPGTFIILNDYIE